MSLLLDALKKAEEAKRQAAATTQAPAAAPATPPAAGLSLEPQAPVSKPLPDLSAHLDTVDADLAAVSKSAPLRKPAAEPARPAPQANDSAERAAVRNVFDAKATPAPDRRPLWIGLGLAGLAAVGIGGWLWWQLQSVGAGSLAARPVAAQPPAAGAGGPATPPMLPPAPTLAPPAPTLAASSPTGAGAPPASAPAFSAAQATEAAATEERATRRAAEAARPAAEPDSPVRLTRSPQRVNATLAQAYEQLQGGQIESAERSYQQVLKNEPNNTDALLGLAAIALQQGQNTRAEGLYLKTLEADPKDANALAGLVNLRGQSDPLTAESRLKTMLATQPDSPTLNFALGNLYAGQARWPEAQQAYFHAHTADAGNPDYLFNLAAALDNMHLPKIALEYYQEALTAASSRRSGFDVNLVKRRILELQP